MDMTERDVTISTLSKLDLASLRGLAQDQGWIYGATEADHDELVAGLTDRLLADRDVPNAPIDAPHPGQTFDDAFFADKVDS